jgi:hypothetical protein
MELAEITIQYDYQALARVKRKREAKWVLVPTTLETRIPSVADAEAPLAGVLTVNNFVERYRIWEGRLYREANKAGPWRGNEFDPRHEPITLAEACAAGQWRYENIGKVPWKWLEKNVEQLFGEIAEIDEEHQAQSAGLWARRARDLLVVDGLIYVPSDPPMLSVSERGDHIQLLSGAEMATSDPEFSYYSNHYTSLFRIDRIEQALAFALAREAKLLERGMIHPRRQPHQLPQQHLSITPGAEALFLVDDMIESARRNLSFACHYLQPMVMSLEPSGLKAFGQLRESVLAMERPEGRTRGNARSAYLAMCEILEAGPGAWAGPARAREDIKEIERSSGYLRDRYLFDPTFAPNQSETLSASEDAAIAMLDGIPSDQAARRP